MRIIIGLIASLVATLAVSVFPLLGLLVGVMSANAQASFTQMGFAIGAAVAFGVSFPLLYKLLPGRSNIAKGSYFGLLVWTATIVLVPMMGADWLTFGLESPLTTLMLYVVYGLLLGIGFQDLSRELTDSTTPGSLRGRLVLSGIDHIVKVHRYAKIDAGPH